MAFGSICCETYLGTLGWFWAHSIMKSIGLGSFVPQFTLRGCVKPRVITFSYKKRQNPVMTITGLIMPMQILRENCFALSARHDYDSKLANFLILGDFMAPT